MSVFFAVATWVIRVVGAGLLLGLAPWAIYRGLRATWMVLSEGIPSLVRWGRHEGDLLPEPSELRPMAGRERRREAA